MNSPQFCKFAAVGLINTLVSAIALATLHKALGFDIRVSGWISYCLGMITSFALNKSWTFEDRSKGWTTVNQIICFVASGLICAFVYSEVVVAVTPFSNLATGIIFATTIAFFLNFLLQKILVFRH
jgi:putative flippase GtrA